VILEHGNFGLGTFESRDGRIVVLDGQLSEAAADAAVGESCHDASPEPYTFESGQ
jgi:alpha-acetolactate decarboxylase